MSRQTKLNFAMGSRQASSSSSAAPLLEMSGQMQTQPVGHDGQAAPNSSAAPASKKRRGPRKLEGVQRRPDGKPVEHDKAERDLRRQRLCRWKKYKRRTAVDLLANALQRALLRAGLSAWRDRPEPILEVSVVNEDVQQKLQVMALMVERCVSGKQILEDAADIRALIEADNRLWSAGTRPHVNMVGLVHAHQLWIPCRMARFVDWSLSGDHVDYELAANMGVVEAPHEAEADESILVPGLTRLVACFEQLTEWHICDTQKQVLDNLAEQLVNLFSEKEVAIGSFDKPIRYAIKNLDGVGKYCAGAGHLGGSISVVRQVPITPEDDWGTMRMADSSVKALLFELGSPSPAQLLRLVLSLLRSDTRGRVANRFRNMRLLVLLLCEEHGLLGWWSRRKTAQTVGDLIVRLQTCTDATIRLAKERLHSNKKYSAPGVYASARDVVRELMKMKGL